MRGLLLLLCLSIISSGCGRQETVPMAYWVSEEIVAVRRIVVIPSQTPASSPHAAQISDQLAAALRKNGRFEVLPLPAQAIPELSQPGGWDNNSIDPAILREISARYACDALLLSRVDRWQAYDPVAIGLQAHLIDVHTGSVVWSAGGDFDARTSTIQESVEAWWERTDGGAQASVSGWRIALSSPRIFANWLTEMMVATLDTLEIDDSPISNNDIGQHAKKSKNNTQLHR